ncbi:hypothetical protein BH10BAC4_BH10BAC4_26420 [soil metagenome]
MNGSATTSDFKHEMEQASGLDFGKFFEQWLYKPGSLVCKGTWQYDDKKKEVQIVIDQVQKDGSLFSMPIQVGIYDANQKLLALKTIQLKEKKNTFTIPLEALPTAVTLDPQSRVLMEASCSKK